MRVMFVAFVPLVLLGAAEEVHIIKPLEGQVLQASNLQGRLDMTGLGNFEHASTISVQLLHQSKSRLYERIGLEKDTGSISSSPVGKVSWYGEDKSTGNMMNLMRAQLRSRSDMNDFIVGSVVDLEDEMICHIKLGHEGDAEVICKPTADFGDELEPLESVGNEEGGNVRRRQESLEREESQDVSFAGEESSGVPFSNQYRITMSPGSGQEGPGMWNKPSRYVQENDEGGNLDVMVVWTSNAECHYSGQKPTSCTLNTDTEDSMMALIRLAVEETNTAYDLSGVETQLRLVHAYRDEKYKEKSSGSSRFTTALNEITSPHDGTMDDVHAKRLQYGADIVAMIIDDQSDICGVAWMGPSKSRMFSVTHWTCATGYYSFGHEIAHNMGCQHDMGTKNACNFNGFNYGWRDPEGEFRSILAYNCRTDQCDDIARSGCARVQRFSNTRYQYKGKDMGHGNKSDNARYINDVKATIASYYKVKVPSCTSDTGCDDFDPCIDKCDVWLGHCVFSEMCETSTTTTPTSITRTETPTTTSKTLATTTTISTRPTSTSNSPSAIPSWTYLALDNFEGSGEGCEWGNYVKGATGGESLDAELIDVNLYASSGICSVRIRDNSEYSYFTLVNPLNVQPYSTLSVKFTFYADGMEMNEDFWVQLEANGSGIFHTALALSRGDGRYNFQNEVRYFVAMTIPLTNVNTINVRFKNDANSDEDSVYIDDIEILAKV